MGAFKQFLSVNNWVQLTIEEGRIELYSSLGTQPSLINFIVNLVRAFFSLF